MMIARLSILIKKSSLLFDKYSNQLLSQQDLTASQFKIMLVLYHATQAVCQKDIEKKFNMTNPTVTGLVQKLEAKGLITRVSREDDQRVKQLVLTQQALDRKEELLSSEQYLEEMMAKNLSGEETEQLCILLTKLIGEDSNL